MAGRNGFGPALELPLGLSWIGQDEAAKCSGRTAGGVNNISNAAGRLLTQIDFVPRQEPEIMIGLCVGVELDLRTACGLKRPRAAPTQGTTLSEKPTEGPRKESKVFSHPMHLWC